jgi:hypothetical protein
MLALQQLSTGTALASAGAERGADDPGAGTFNGDVVRPGVVLAHPANAIDRSAMAAHLHEPPRAFDRGLLVR